MNLNSVVNIGNVVGSRLNPSCSCWCDALRCRRILPRIAGQDVSENDAKHDAADEKTHEPNDSQRDDAKHKKNQGGTKTKTQSGEEPHDRMVATFHFVSLRPARVDSGDECQMKIMPKTSKRKIKMKNRPV